MMPSALHHPAGALADATWSLSLGPEVAGWSYSGLRVADLAPGGSVSFQTGEDEVLVLPLSGSTVVESDGERAELVGRRDVFSGVTDFAYL